MFFYTKLNDVASLTRNFSSILGVEEEVPMGPDADSGDADTDGGRHDAERDDPCRHDARGRHARGSDTRRDDSDVR